MCNDSQDFPFNSTFTHFPKATEKAEPLKLNYRFYSRRKYVVEEGIVTFTTLRFFYSEYRLLWTFFYFKFIYFN